MTSTTVAAEPPALAVGGDEPLAQQAQREGGRAVDEEREGPLGARDHLRQRAAGGVARDDDHARCRCPAVGERDRADEPLGGGGSRTTARQPATARPRREGRRVTREPYASGGHRRKRRASSANPSPGARIAARDPRIDAYIAKAQPFAQPILRHLRELVHTACPDAEETMKSSSRTSTIAGR